MYSTELIISWCQCAYQNELPCNKLSSAGLRAFIVAAPVGLEFFGKLSARYYLWT